MSESKDYFYDKSFENTISTYIDKTVSIHSKPPKLNTNFRIPSKENEFQVVQRKSSIQKSDSPKKIFETKMQVITIVLHSNEIIEIEIDQQTTTDQLLKRLCQQLEITEHKSKYFVLSLDFRDNAQKTKIFHQDEIIMSYIIHSSEVKDCYSESIVSRDGDFEYESPLLQNATDENYSNLIFEVNLWYFPDIMTKLKELMPDFHSPLEVSVAEKLSPLMCTNFQLPSVTEKVKIIVENELIELLFYQIYHSYLNSSSIISPEIILALGGILFLILFNENHHNRNNLEILQKLLPESFLNCNKKELHQEYREIINENDWFSYIYKEIIRYSKYFDYLTKNELIVYFLAYQRQIFHIDTTEFQITNTAIVQSTENDSANPNGFGFLNGNDKYYLQLSYEGVRLIKYVTYSQINHQKMKNVIKVLCSHFRKNNNVKKYFSPKDNSKQEDVIKFGIFDDSINQIILNLSFNDILNYNFNEKLFTMKYMFRGQVRYYLNEVEFYIYNILMYCRQMICYVKQRMDNISMN